MIRLNKLLIAGIFLLSISQNILAQELQGYVRDKESKEILPGATIYIPDLRTGAVSDAEGKYKVTNLPKRKLLVQVRLIGYSTISLTIDLKFVNQQDFYLQMSEIEKDEIVVTGSAFTTDARRTSVVVSPIDKLKITSAASDNLVQSLANIPGISVISTGNAISKPVIRGLGFNRVVVVNEGIRQEGQQWGNEHGLEIDQFSADRIEVLKGPSSLLYGSDALGGVINILEPILPPPGKIRGELNSQFSSNNLLSSNSLMAEGNSNGLTWRGRATYKNAAPFKTPTETVLNSAYEEKSADVLVGIHKRWGFTHIHASQWFNSIGITEGRRDSVSNKFLDEDGNIATASTLNSRNLSVPFQQVGHSKLSITNNFIIAKGQIRFNAGYQENDREEYSDSKYSPAMWLRLKTINYDLKYYLPEKNNFETALGVSGMRQDNENRADEFLIPDYSLNDFGIFSSIKKSYALTTINAGVRYDHRNLNVPELYIDTALKFKAMKQQFSSISASVGITHQLTEKLDLKTNIGRGFRAPNIPELSSNGVHEGIQKFEIGNPDLKPETSLQFDFGILFESKTVEASLNLFLNNIDNFIYTRKLNNEIKTDQGIDYPIYMYVQGQSTLKGGEFTLDVHPVKRLHFENSLSFVQGQNEAIDQPLPFIPPLKIVNELKYEFSDKPKARFTGTYVKLELVSSATQNRIDVFETPTKAYSLLNLGVGSNLRLGKQLALLYLRVGNLFNKSYYDHLSRMKEIGVNGPGRNLSLGIMVPIGIK